MPTTTTTAPSSNPVLPVTDRHALRVLRLLFELAQADVPAHVGALCARLSLSPRAVADHLLTLDQAGLARADHARLTMSGLVLAARLPAVCQTGRAPGAAGSQPPRIARAARPSARAPRSLPVGWSRTRSVRPR